MKSCICTVIKNEHQYLDEWIQYHVNLGIDHLYIFEDIDSESHKDITNKYSYVSLDNIDNILTEQQRKEARNLKQQTSINVQDLYFKSILNKLKNEHLYDWCFVIDIDEFIICNNLKNTINLYSDYDAFMMSWEAYGACEHISKPNENVVKSYSYKSTGFINNKPIFHTKTCYNLNTFKTSNYWTNHQPSNSCKWCRTDFTQDRTKYVFDNIYIKHYITKSWEEYVEKKYKRGFFVGISRTNDFFFNLNPELNCMKQELMEAMKNEILVILPYKQSSSQGTELEIALSLWRKNCTFKYHFIVIGEYDKSFVQKFPWVEFIECKSKEKVDDQYNPHLDILNKFIIAMTKYQDKYTGFIAMCDDIYAIKPFTIFDILQTHYHSKSFDGNKNAPTSYWRYDKWKTRQLFDKENLSHINYTTHFPYWYDIEKLKFIIDKFNLKNESYVLEDIYFNYYEHDKPILDSEIRLGIWNYDIYKRDFQSALENPNIKFMCNSVEGWSADLENSLKKLCIEGPKETSKICVCTVIKDEQEYLEDWIKYNINLGIDKIYIFEDFGSETHKEITDKYSDNVELLDSSFFELNEKLYQNEIQQKLFNYIRKKNIYDWCFIMDVDEYLTLENPNDDIHEVLNQYNDQAEVLVFWKNYGANGHIEKPDYSKVESYREYYTKECGYSNMDLKYHYINKKATNLHKASPNYHISHHIPSMIYYVNTNGIKDFKTPCFKKLYIKHYVTKSWEEYTWKLLKRGMCCKNHRKIDDFFEMNKDMQFMKDELIKSIESE